MTGVTDTIFGMVDVMAGSTIWNPGVGNENVIMLFKNNPTLTQESVIGDLDPADFDGSAPKACGAGPATMGLDPVTGQWMIRPVEPLGGFEFEVSGGANLPQTIFGFALCSEGLVGLIAWQKFDTPIVLTAVAQIIDIPQPRLNVAFDLFN